MIPVSPKNRIGTILLRLLKRICTRPIGRIGQLTRPAVER